MLTALLPPALPGLAGRLPRAPAQRQDSSGSSGSYHTAPGSPQPPDVGSDAEGLADWLWVAPGRGAGAQPRLSVSAQNSRQQPSSGSGFQRDSGSGLPARPQLRMLPSGEMEVIFSAGPLLRRPNAEDLEVQRLTAPAISSSSPSGPRSPIRVSPPPQPPDEGSRWATYLELRPRGPSPAVSGQFECIEVALEERPAPVRSRTVPKRQIELRPRPRSPSGATCAPRPRLLLRTGSLDESLSRLQAAAGVVQTALAKKMGPAVPAPSNVTFRPKERSESAAQETARSTRRSLEEARSRPPRVHESSAPTRAPRPWPSLRERAIRRDKPTPGNEPLGPVSSSIFLQSEEKIQEARSQEPKTRFSREALDQSVPRTRSPPVQSRAPDRAVPPRSPSPPPLAPNGGVQCPRCPSPQNHWQDRTVWRVSSPSFTKVSSWDDQNAAVDEAVGRRSPSPPPLSQRTQRARARSPTLEAPSGWAALHPTGRDAVGRGRGQSPPTVLPWEPPDRPVGTRSPSSVETRGAVRQAASKALMREAMNGLAQEVDSPTLPALGTPELSEVLRPPTKENLDIAFRGSESSPEIETPDPARSHLIRALDDDALPEAQGSREATSRPPRVAIPRPRDVRKIVKTTYAPSFPARTPGSGLPVPSAEPCGDEVTASESQELQHLESPAPAHYTSVFLKDFLPIVPHPYECPEPSLPTVPADAPQLGGIPRRRAENSTAKPFARSEIRLPGSLALGRRPERTPGVPVRCPGGEPPDAEAPRLVPDGEGRTSPLGGARTSTQRSPIGAGQPPRPGSPPACPSPNTGRTPKLEAPPAVPEPSSAVQAPLLQEPQASARRNPTPQPRAASAPPTDRLPSASSQGVRRPLAAAHPGKVLVDPESGRYYFVEAPRQPRLRLLFDPESGQYVEVLLPPSSPGPPRHVYNPLALAPSLYPPAYGPVPAFSLPSSPNVSALSSPQLPWAPETGPLDGMYYVPVSGTPSPAPPLLLCAPPSSSGSIPPSKGSVLRL